MLRSSLLVVGKRCWQVKPSKALRRLKLQMDEWLACPFGFRHLLLF